MSQDQTNSFISSQLRPLQEAVANDLASFQDEVEKLRGLLNSTLASIREEGQKSKALVTTERLAAVKAVEDVLDRALDTIRAANYRATENAEFEAPHRLGL